MFLNAFWELLKEWVVRMHAEDRNDLMMFNDTDLSAKTDEQENSVCFMSDKFYDMAKCI